MGNEREALVKKKVCEYLDTIAGLWWDRREALGLSYKKGVPDLYAVYKGYHIEIETKREKGGKLSTMQEKFKAAAPTYGMIYVNAKSVDDVKRLIKRIDEVK